MLMTETITLDLTLRQETRQLLAKQGDRDTRLICCRLTAGTERFTIPEDAAARILFCKADGNHVLNDAAVDREEGTVSFLLTRQMLAAAGTAQCELLLYSGEELLSSGVFRVVVLPQAANGSGIESAPEYHAFTDALGRLETALKNSEPVLQRAGQLCRELEELQLWGNAAGEQFVLKDCGAVPFRRLSVKGKTKETFAAGQSGKSPEYPSVISGWTPPAVTLRGRNLFDPMVQPFNLANCTLTQAVDGITVENTTATASYHARAVFRYYLAAGSYCFSRRLSAAKGTLVTTSGDVQISSEDGTLDTFFYQADQGWKEFTLEKAGWVKFFLFVKRGEGAAIGTAVQFGKLMLCETKADYEPYRSRSYQTGYAGFSLPDGSCDELDLVSGKLTQRVEQRILSGAEPWQVVPGKDGLAVFSLSGMPDCGICNRLKDAGYTWNLNEESILFRQDGTMLAGIRQERLAGYTANLPDQEKLALWNGWLSKNPLTVYLPSAPSVISGNHNSSGSTQEILPDNPVCRIEGGQGAVWTVEYRRDMGQALQLK